MTRAALRCAELVGDDVVGIIGGWAGLLERNLRPITFEDFEDVIGTGGTLLSTSRTNPMKEPDGLNRIRANMAAEHIDALIAVGGDDTLGVAAALAATGTKVIGVPKTIDNDLAGTDYSFGFFSAVDEAMRLSESLGTTGRSHGRVMVVEIMGRDAGWIAAYAGIAAGANMILVPEFETDLEDVVRVVKSRAERHKSGSLIVVAEGVKLGYGGTTEKDAFGHALLAKAQGESNAAFLARYIEERTGMDTRATVLGHTIRGTAPDAYDRIVSTKLGFRAMELAHAGKFGVMVALRGTEVVDVPLSEGSKKKYLDKGTWDLARHLFV
ncbi:MAG: ATP-dependent 6-phosphofructokinase [Candidatus Marsarchaeota archaeon]|nr:ATP-dependent 6-phosphofructokinase [Candidatus Marsarchaeota archaeon]